MDVSYQWIEPSFELKQSHSNEKHFVNSGRVMSSLNRNAVYEELVSVRLVGMMLTIIVRQELRKNVVRYSTETVGTGALNFMVKPPLII